MREDPENGLAFVGPEDAMQADEKEKSSVVLVIKGPCGWYKPRKSATCMMVSEVTNIFKVGSEACSMSENSCLV